MSTRKRLATTGLTLLFLCFLMDLIPVAQSMSLMKMCGLDNDNRCLRDIDVVPDAVAEVCDACGNFWGNVEGFSYCCRCSDKVFEFCYIAVFGGKK